MTDTQPIAILAVDDEPGVLALLRRCLDDDRITLTEAASTQTRLNQVFTLGANDRFLTFTLSNIGLDDVNNAPDDAFEVALLNATTGASLLGGTGLMRNDAIINLQADGSEHAASGVTSRRNADGSRSYVVDLAALSGGSSGG